MKKIRDNEKRLFSNTVMLYLMKFSTMIFPLITFPYLTRVLGTEMYGLQTFVSSYTAYFVLFIDFGFVLSATKEIAINKENKDKVQTILSSVIIAKIIFGVISLIVGVGIAFFLPATKNYVIYVALSLLSIILSTLLPDFLFRGIEKMGAATARYVITKSIFTALMFFVVKAPEHIYRIPILTMIGEFVAILITWIYIYRKLHYRFIWPKFSNIIEQIKISVVYFYSRIATTVYSNTNTFMLGLYQPLSIVGLYGIANTITNMIKSFYTPISDSLYPYMLRNRNFKLLFKTLLIFMPIIIVGSVVLAIWAPFFLKLAGGENYVEATTVLRCLLPTVVIVFPSYLLGFPTMGPLGLNKQANYTVIFSSVFHVIGLVILMILDQITIESVAILTCLTEGVVLLLRIAYLVNYKRTGRTYFFKCKKKQSINKEEKE